jgi:hypothetical protein
MAAGAMRRILRADASSKLAASDGTSIIKIARKTFRDGMQRFIDAPERGRVSRLSFYGAACRKCGQMVSRLWQFVANFRCLLLAALSQWK